MLLEGRSAALDNCRPCSYLYKCISGSRRRSIYKGSNEVRQSPASRCRPYGGRHCTACKYEASAIAHTGYKFDVERETKKEEKERTIDVVTKGTGAMWRRSSPEWLVKHAWCSLDWSKDPIRLDFALCRAMKKNVYRTISSCFSLLRDISSVIVAS